MAKKHFTWGIPVMVLVFGMMVVGCEVEEEKPNNTISYVTISGTERMGSRLIATARTANGSSVTGVTWQWKRGDSASGTFINIIGETFWDYNIVAADVGKFILVEARNSDTNTPILSNVLGPIDSNQVATPAASPVGGEIAPGQRITLSTTTEYAQIYYTLDGSTPTSSSIAYSGQGVEITANSTLRAIAIAFIPGSMTNSEILTETYTIMPGISFSPVTSAVFNSTGISTVAYGDGQFVAAGGGIIAYSSNGTNWTSSSSSISSVNGIIHGGTRFVAVGSNGRIAHSSTGTSWTEYTSTSFETTRINSAAYGNSRFVAVGEDGKIAVIIENTAGWSSNSWTGITAGIGTGRTQFSATSSINDIAYGAGRFVAVGSGGQMAFSTDGQTWVAITNSVLTGSINSIAYGGVSGKEKFIAVGSNGLASSTDGLTWTRITTIFWLSESLMTVTWGDNKFIAGGSQGVMVYSNADGSLWAKIEGGLGTGKSQFDTTGGLLPSSINDITYGGGKFLAVGSNRSAMNPLTSSGEIAISE